MQSVKHSAYSTFCSQMPSSCCNACFKHSISFFSTLPFFFAANAVEKQHREGFEVGERAESSPYPQNRVRSRRAAGGFALAFRSGNRLFREPLGRWFDFRVSGFANFHLRTCILISSAPAIRAYIPYSFWRFFTSYKANVRSTPIILALTASPHNSVSLWLVSCSWFCSLNG